MKNTNNTKQRLVRQQSSKLYYEGAIGRLDGYGYSSESELSTEPIEDGSRSNVIVRVLARLGVAGILAFGGMQVANATNCAWFY